MKESFIHFPFVVVPYRHLLQLSTFFFLLPFPWQPKRIPTAVLLFQHFSTNSVTPTIKGYTGKMEDNFFFPFCLMLSRSKLLNEQKRWKCVEFSTRRNVTMYSNGSIHKRLRQKSAGEGRGRKKKRITIAFSSLDLSCRGNRKTSVPTADIFPSFIVNDPVTSKISSPPPAMQERGGSVERGVGGLLGHLLFDVWNPQLGKMFT
jgi:hypothetical protein